MKIIEGGVGVITTFGFAPKRACEACVFGRGEHAVWCQQPARDAATESLRDPLWREVSRVKPTRLDMLCGSPIPREAFEEADRMLISLGREPVNRRSGA